MRIANGKKVKLWLLSCLVFLTAVFCAVFGVKFFNPVLTSAEEVTTNRTLLSGEYQTNGASMRIFKKTSSGNLETISATEQGIRFHVEMGSGYKYGTTTLFDETNKNERGSWTIADGFTTYTLVLPKRLMGDATDLTPTTDKVMKLNTTDYWFTDKNGNIESIAYIYNIPAAYRTDTFVFKGIICDENGEVIAETETAERCLAFIAKMSYKDTINPDTVMWGTEEKPLDDVAAVALKAFVPTYTINYAMTNGETQTEEVLWGEKPANIPAFDIPENEHIDYTQSWFDQDRKEEFNIKAAMEWAENKTFNLAQASATEFNLTGVADYNNFVIDSIGYSGAKLYATLDPNQLYTEDERNNGTDRMVEVATKAENFTYEGNGSFNGIDGVWALLEGQGGNAQMRLIVAFDSSSMVNGDKIVIEEGTAFYANGLMYVLSQEYTIDYAEVDSVEDYGVFLGYLHNSDIKNVKNWIEPTDQTRKRIRVEFRKDVFINSDFKIVYDGELPSGYEYPLYVHCEQGGGLTPITQGFYYWNNGQHTILELEGFGHHGDEILYGVPGLKIVQNNGYFIYEDAIKWENDGSGNWVEGTEKGTFGANSFEIIGSHASDTTEVRFTTNGNTTLTAGGTTNRWFNGTPTLNVENMSESEPYAVFVTKPDGTVMPLEKFKYHGQDIDAGYHHILGFTGYEGTVAGETITILGGSRFWFESEYYTASETIIFYFNGTSWVVNTDGTANQMITMDDFLGKNYNFQEGGVNKLRMLLVEDANLFNGGNGALILERGSVKVNGRAYTNLRYYGQYIDSNDGSTKYHMIFEIIGDKLAPIGQTAFVDTLVIEAGTKIWIGVDKEASTQPYCIEFSETLEWRYVGEGMRDGGGNPYDYDWIRTDNNTNLDHTSILSMYDATDAGGEVRMNLAAGTLTDNFYGYMAMDMSKGVPVVNGIEMPNEAFSYSSGNQLFAVRGGEYGYALESYIIIPEGSVWWTTQGSFTFVETIYGVVRSLKDNGTGNWTTGFNTLTSLGDISATDFMGAENYTEFAQDGTTVLYKEIRARISREYSNTYYGVTAIIGEAVVEKANGTQAKALFGQWYSGTAYDKDHSLVSFRGDAMIDVTDGDVFTIKAGTKLVLGGLGYHTLLEDVVYTYHNGSWQVGDLHATVTYNGTNATVSGTTEALQGDTCTFTVMPNSGYAVTSVMVNGNSLAITENNEYSFTAISGENKVYVTAKKLYAVTWSNPTGATISVSANGSAVTNGATVVEGTVLTVNATAAASHNVTGITANGAAVTNGGTYTVTGATTIAATTAIKTYTVTANCSGGVSVDATSKTVQHGNSVTFTLNVPANATIKANGTVINGNTYTVSNVTGDTTVTFTTWYNVTMNAGNSTVSGDVAGLYQQGDTFDFTVADTLSHNVTGVTSNGSSIGTAAGSYSVKVNGATTIAVATAEKTKYTVSWTNPTGATIAVSANETGTVTNGGQVYVGQTLTVTITPSTGYRLDTVSGLGSVTVDKTHAKANTFTYTVGGNTTISATTVQMYTVSWKATNATYTVTNTTTGATISTSGTYVDTGTEISVKVAAATVYNITGVSINGSSVGTAAGTYTHTVTSNTNITNTAESSICIVEGTMITLADGTQKAIEDVEFGDMLLVFNHFTGEFDTRPVVAISHYGEPAQLCRILNLQFSDGTIFRMVGHHGLFDKTLGEYVMINIDNVAQYLGHEFYAVSTANDEFIGTTVTLTNYYETEETVRVFSPATAEFANYFAAGLLNAPPLHRYTLTSGHMNYFEFDENLKYNEEQVQADIEKYGLYTYEDFADYISEDVFNALSFKYFKIAVEKGLMTEEDIYGLIYELNNT